MSQHEWEEALPCVFRFKKKIVAEDSDRVLGPATKHLPDINVILGTTSEGDRIDPCFIDKEAKV